jgi:hypothetical protein
MVVVQVRVDDDVYVVRRQTVFGKPFFKGVDGAAYGLFAVFGLDGLHFARIHQNLLVAALDIPAVDRDGVGLPVVVLIGHHAFIKYLGSHDNGMDFVLHGILRMRIRDGSTESISTFNPDVMGCPPEKGGF